MTIGDGARATQLDAKGGEEARRDRRGKRSGETGGRQVITSPVIAADGGLLTRTSFSLRSRYISPKIRRSTALSASIHEGGLCPATLTFGDEMTRRALRSVLN
jgi:hypothetical protein